MSDEPVAGPEVSAEDGPSGVEALRDAVSIAMEGCVGDIERTDAVLEVIVRELGITPEMVEDCREAGDAATRGDRVLPDSLWGQMNRVAAALSVLLHAAGRRPHYPRAQGGPEAMSDDMRSVPWSGLPSELFDDGPEVEPMDTDEWRYECGCLLEDDEARSVPEEYTAFWPECPTHNEPIKPEVQAELRRIMEEEGL